MPTHYWTPPPSVGSPVADMEIIVGSRPCGPFSFGESRYPYNPVSILKPGQLSAGRLADRSNPEINMTGQTQTAVAAWSSPTIIDRGRGPEIAGTRITIYDVMDFLKCEYPLPDIAKALWLTDEQVGAAVEYIRSHQAESDREYGLIMERMNQPNPPEVERGRAKTREELQRRIRARVTRNGAHDHTVRS